MTRTAGGMKLDVVIATAQIVVPKSSTSRDMLPIEPGTVTVSNCLDGSFFSPVTPIYRRLIMRR